MTTRNEPTVGAHSSAFDIAGLFSTKKVAKTPEKLMEEALKGFTDAQAGLEAAQAEIALQVAEHEAEIERRQKALTSANESSSRLGRVAERFKELLS